MLIILKQRTNYNKTHFHQMMNLPRHQKRFSLSQILSKVLNHYLNAITNTIKLILTAKLQNAI